MVKSLVESTVSHSSDFLKKNKTKTTIMVAA
jgi:hypothetical protein